MSKRILFLVTGLIISAAFFVNIQPAAATVTPSITVTSPSSGEALQIGQRYTIKWNWNYVNYDPREAVQIIAYLNENYGQASNVIGEAEVSKGTFDWTAGFPGLTIKSGDKFFIQVRLKSNIGVYGNSGDFSLVSSLTPSITVTSPNGGETWKVGETRRITWQASNFLSIDKVRVYIDITDVISISSGVSNYVTDQEIPASQGYYDWTITQNQLPYSSTLPHQYKIRISKSVDPYTTYDSSDAAFSIVAAGTPAPTPTPTPTPVPTNACLPDNALIKMPDDPKVYVIVNCQKKWIQTAEEFKDEGYKWTDVKEVNSPVVQAYTDYQQATANLLKAIGQEKVYKVVNNKLLWVPTISAFNAQGLKWSDVQSVDTSQLNQYQRAKLLQINGDQKIYYITESGLKKHILNESVFNSYNNKWEDVVTVDAAVINSYPDANLIKAEDGYQVYKLENGQKRWIKTDAAFRRLKLDWNKVVPVNETELAAYPDGAAIE